MSGKSIKIILTVAAGTLLSFVLLFSAGCGKTAKEDGLNVPSDTILLAVKKDQSSAGSQAELERFIDAYTAAFTARQPGIKVSVRYYTELPKETAGIDCMLLGADDMLLYFNEGLCDADGFLDNYGISRSDLAGGAARAASVFEDAPLKMVPFNYDHAVLIADKALFSEAGAALPDRDWNIDNFETVCESLTGRRSGTAYSGVYMPYYMNYVWQYYCNMFAGSYLENGRFNFTKDNAQGIALDRMYSMYTHNLAYSPMLSNVDRVCAMSFTYASQPWRNNFSFETEKLTSLNPGKRVDELLEKGTFVLLPLPSSGGKRTGIANTDFIKGFAVPADSKKQDMAGRFAAFSLTEEGQKLLISHYGGIPANRNMWDMDFWRTGVFSGDNALCALIGADDGVRDDFTAALKGDPDIYNKNIRMRSVYSAIMVRELNSAKGFDNYMRKLAMFQIDANKVIDGLVSVYSRK